MEGGKEQNYWPGFVDALSNVVLTLVFVLVIFVFALIMASNKVAKKMTEVAAAEKAQAQGQAELDKALAELGKLRAQESDPAAIKAAANGSQQLQSCMLFNKSDASQKAEVDHDAASILILFGSNAISVTDDTTKLIHDFIDAYRARTGNANAKFIVESPENPASTNPLMAREVQLGRMLNIRNSLLSGKIGAGYISVHNIAPLQQGGSYDWVKIHVEQ